MKNKLLLLSLAVMLCFTFTACEAEKNDGDAGTKETKLEFKDAAEHILYSQFNSLNSEGMGFDVKLKLESDLKPYLSEISKKPEHEKYINFTNDIIKDLTLNYTLKYMANEQDNKVPNIDLKYGLLLKDKPFVDFVGSINDDSAGISFPAVSNKGLSVDYKKLLKENNEESLKKLELVLNLDLKKYANILMGGKDLYTFFNEDLDGIKTVYSKYINDTFSKTETKSITRDGKDIPVTEYKSNYNYKKALEFNKILLNELKKNDKLRLLISERCSLLIDEFINSKDYEKFKVTKEELEIAKKNLSELKGEEAKKMWEEGLDKLISMYDDMDNNPDTKKIYDMFNNLNTEQYIRITNDNKVDSIYSKLTYNDEKHKSPIILSLDLIYLGKDQLTFIDHKNLLDVTKYVGMSDEDLKNNIQEETEAINYAKEFALEAINYALNGENFKYIYELMDKHKLFMEKSIIRASLEQSKSKIEEMKLEQLLELNFN